MEPGPQHETRPPPPDCDRIAGCLVLLAINLVGAGCSILKSAGDIIADFGGAPHAAWLASPARAVPYVAWALVDLATTGIWVVLLPAFFRRRRHARVLLSI